MCPAIDTQADRAGCCSFGCHKANLQAPLPFANSNIHSMAQLAASL
jgi:hypothetical protein